MNNSKILIIIIAIVIGVVSFFGGMQYQKTKPGLSIQGQNGNSRRMGMNQNSRPVSGEITGIDDKSITIKLTDGSSKIVVLSSSSVYVKTSEATKSDLKTGDKVIVIGTQNSDGSVTAQNVQIGSGLKFR